ncbi:glycosyltransferase [Exiguobacterium acetylicum]|uniref:glycosyltransferase n=1 Tax=Exiguobacterium acetylicum TaxID=41170 RepID=UPI0034D39AD5
MKKNILMILINYNNHSEVIEYCEKVYSQIRKNYTITIKIVDNSSNIEERKALVNSLKDYESIKIYSDNDNLGYFKAANYAYEKSISEKEHYDWFIISNTDIDYKENDFFEQLISKYPLGYPGIIAPSIISLKSKRDQNPYAIKRFSKKRLVFYKNLYKSDFLTKIASIVLRIRNKKIKGDNVTKTIVDNEIYAPHGAFVILNNHYFDVGGDLRYDSFLFCEEIYLGEISKEIGTKIKYDNSLIVIHDEHSSTSLVKKNKMLKYSRESIEYILDKFYT